MTIYKAGSYTYEYTVINDIPASPDCIGMTVKTLCWGLAKIVAYKNSKNIDILFLESGNVETVQKAALDLGNVADSVQRTFNNQLKKDKAIIAKCNEQIEKARKKAKMAHRRIASRVNNRKERLDKAMEKYNIKGVVNDSDTQESTCTEDSGSN